MNQINVDHLTPNLNAAASGNVVLPVIPANLQMDDVQTAFLAMPEQGNRQYYACPTPPTDPAGLLESHFKGVASFADKLIFTHTNLDPCWDPSAPSADGKYLIGDIVGSGGQGEIDEVGDTAPSGWPHPCAAQACGSFMAMGIQKSASGSGSDASEIQVYDLRDCLLGQPITVLGTIERPEDGINGVGMTKEAGPDGKYLIAGVNGRVLTVYRSTTSTLVPWGATKFVQVLKVCDFPASGAGLALITQTHGGVFLVSLNADDDGANSRIGLFKLDLDATPPACIPLLKKEMNIPGMSDSLTILEAYLDAQPLWGPVLGGLLKLGSNLLNSSFRWGKGLSITSAASMEIYATDRNVVPLSHLPDSGSKKDFSVVVWASSPTPPRRGK
ncbi:hypothetical protein [Massilia scottii]|uniref:hypothetical protein n=1 Tax=Massilia scottii TaxID=3057166 RepID=UPI00279677A4|nr:hypothetical protein [Massilia sp. CCM 9029]MDQ1833487.1 hypothetical protein [Massilia sp. CCM 9029]